MNEQKDSGGDVRDHILEAACERFGQYGYNKTTMAEIAKDCDMSASNIYRFFENKLQIGATLASDCLAERVANMRLEIENTGLSCETRLRNLIHRMFQDTYEQMSDHPKINELVVAVCNEKPDIVKQHARNKREIVERLLHEAVAAGEFQSQDISRSARAEREIS